MKWSFAIFSWMYCICGPDVACSRLPVGHSWFKQHFNINNKESELVYLFPTNYYFHAFLSKYKDYRSSISFPSRGWVQFSRYWGRASKNLECESLQVVESWAYVAEDSERTKVDRCSRGDRMVEPQVSMTGRLRLCSRWVWAEGEPGSRGISWRGLAEQKAHQTHVCPIAHLKTGEAL